jgi:hypothetical protein
MIRRNLSQITPVRDSTVSIINVPLNLIVDDHTIVREGSYL